jgi:PAS domain S-box-containing protein
MAIRTRTAATKTKPSRAAQRAVCGRRGVGGDITKREQTEIALRQSEQRYRMLIEQAADGLFVTDAQAGRILDVNSATCRMFGCSRAEMLRQSVADMVAPAEASRITPEVAMVQRGATVQSEWRMRRRDGSFFPGEISARQLPDGCIQGFIRDITERKQAEHLLQRANRTLQAIRDCHEAMLRAGTEHGLLEEICRIIVQTGGERMAWVGFADKDERKAVRPVAAAGFSKDYLTDARITWADKLRGRGPVGTAIRTGKVCICHNAFTDPNFVPWRGFARRCGYASIIALPLTVDGQCIGALSIYTADPGVFDAGEQLLFTDLANDLAFGIGTLRLRAERERLQKEILKSAEREQERIGRDLHDGLCQLLVGAKFRSGYLKNIARGRFPAMEQEAAGLEEMLNHAIEQARDLARGLNPVIATPAGLAAALQQLADNVDGVQGPRCLCRFQDSVKIYDHHAAYHLYRIAQEAVQNALKHAGAKNISIALTQRQNRAVLTIKDDGAGIPRAPKENGMGLSNMQTRAKLIGSRLEVRPGKHGGTAVTCELPPLFERQL